MFLMLYCGTCFFELDVTCEYYKKPEYLFCKKCNKDTKVIDYDEFYDIQEMIHVKKYLGTKQLVHNFEENSMKMMNNTISTLHNEIEKKNMTNINNSKLYGQIKETEKAVPPFDKSKEKKCHVCSSESTSRCSICHIVYYCSKKCQKSHWSHHKYHCEGRK